MLVTDAPRVGLRRGQHWLAGWIVGLCAMMSAAPDSAAQQWSGSYATAAMPGRFNWEFRSQHPRAADVLNVADVARQLALQTLAVTPRAARDELDVEGFEDVAKLLVEPPRLPVAPEAYADFKQLAPEAHQLVEWTRTLQRQVYDVLADPRTASEDKDGRLVELLGYYRARRDLAIAGTPKSLDLPEGQVYSRAFRQRYPKYNGLLWSTQWLETALLESLVAGATGTERRAGVEAATVRFERMRSGAPAAAPYVVPLSPAVAPSFAIRYPTLAAIFDNARMLEGTVLDILASREIPRRAKRIEIRRALEQFRSDTAQAVSYQTWMAVDETIGANNMGGRATDTSPATPTVALGASMAGRMAPASGQAGAMAAMQHGAVQDTGSIRAVYERMMADPVIRERAATDPVLQQLMRAAGLTPPAPGGAAMPGMQHRATTGGQPAMPGRQHGAAPGGTAPGTASGAAAMLAPNASPEDRERAVEFIVRLFSDPAVEARIHSDPELHQLWSDPDVQRRLAELRAAPRAPAKQPTPAPSRTPAPPPPAPSHQHPRTP